MAPVARDPPLCRLAELRDYDPARGRGTYTINDLADFHELMAEEAEYRRRRKAIEERDR
jgi:hypothetical protein